MVKSPEHSLPPDTVWVKYVQDRTKEYQYKYRKNKKKSDILALTLTSDFR